MAPPAATPDGTIASYTWTQTAGTPAVTLTSGTTSQPTFPAPTVATATTLTFSLVVTDNRGATSPARDGQRHGEPVLNVAPTANAGSNQTVTSGVTVTLERFREQRPGRQHRQLRVDADRGHAGGHSCRWLLPLSRRSRRRPLPPLPRSPSRWWSPTIVGAAECRRHRERHGESAGRGNVNVTGQVHVRARAVRQPLHQTDSTTQRPCNSRRAE